MAVLDTHMLSTNSPQLSPSKERRQSLADSSASFSPNDASWSNFSFSLENPAADASDSSMHPFYSASTGAVMPSNPAVQNSSFSPNSAWNMNDNSGSCTPTPNFDQISFPQQQQQQQQQPATEQRQSFNPVQLHQAPQQLPPASAGFPPSSPPAKDNWFSMSSDGMEFRPLPTLKSPHATNFATSTHILRRDGIRKKNARFEIPAERNLRTIDQLINQSTDEQEIKELKQQKRLLRNRQAALDSRQRKKQHTERLEEEKKQYTSVITELEEALSESRSRQAELMRQKDGWVHAQQQFQQCVDTLVMEKDELIRRHTIETGELRKKCAVLTDQMQRMESTAMSTAPSSAGFSNDFSEFEHLTMNSWDDFSLSNEFSLEHDHHAEVPPVHHPSIAAPKKQQHHQQPLKAAAAGDDKAVTSSVLLMLLLCGAWVVSHGPKSSSDILPAVSDEMKSASAAVLDNLYRDSGIPLGSASGQPAVHNPADIEMAGVGGPNNGLPQSSLESLHHRLVQPTEQQMHAQAFSLTPTQYNELTSGIGPYAPGASAYEGPGSASGRTVGEVLAADPGHLDGSAAESYTHSVLKGRVSSQVLREFARMVAATKQDPAVRQLKSEAVD